MLLLLRNTSEKSDPLFCSEAQTSHYIYLLPVAKVLLGLLCKITQLYRELWLGRSCRCWGGGE